QGFDVERLARRAGRVRGGHDAAPSLAAPTAFAPLWTIAEFRKDGAHLGRGHRRSFLLHLSDDVARPNRLAHLAGELTDALGLAPFPSLQPAAPPLALHTQPLQDLAHLRACHCRPMIRFDLRNDIALANWFGQRADGLPNEIGLLNFS